MGQALNPPKEARDLSRAELEDIVNGIAEILWGPEGNDADREWDSETIEAVAGTLTDAGMGPQ